MARVSRKQADQHRKDIVEAAARLFRERGIDGVSLPELMGEAGLTHGAFYGHFPSKDDLAAIACSAAFEDKQKLYEDILARHADDRHSARTEFLRAYLSRRHRDDPGTGCPAAAMCAEVARDKAGGAARSAFVNGVRMMVERLASLVPRHHGKAKRQETLAAVSLMVGALVLSRATRDHNISDELLAAARQSLLGANNS